MMTSQQCPNQRSATRTFGTFLAFGLIALSLLIQSPAALASPGLERTLAVSAIVLGGCAIGTSRVAPADGELRAARNLASIAIGCVRGTIASLAVGLDRVGGSADRNAPTVAIAAPGQNNCEALAANLRSNLTAPQAPSTGVRHFAVCVQAAPADRPGTTAEHVVTTVLF